jgi:drug/metabolite transporter (DMT)-like permease
MSAARSDHPSPSTSLVPVACLLIVGGLLGLTANIVKLAGIAGWHPIAFLFWSTLGGSTLLLGLAVMTGTRPGLARRHLSYYAISGLISIALPNALAFMAVSHVGAGFVALCLAFPPLLTSALALIMGMEAFRLPRGLGVLFGLVGAVILALAKGSAQSGDLIWVLAALIGPVFLACGNIYRTRHWPTGATALSLAPGMLFGGAVLVLPYALATGLSLAPPSLDDVRGWLLLGQAMVFAAAYALYFILQKLAGPVYLSQIGSVGAFLGALFAVFVLGEPAPPALFLAMACVLIGVVLVNRCLPAGRRAR